MITRLGLFLKNNVEKAAMDHQHVAFDFWLDLYERLPETETLNTFLNGLCTEQNAICDCPTKEGSKDCYCSLRRSIYAQVLDEAYFLHASEEDVDVQL